MRMRYGVTESELIQDISGLDHLLAKSANRADAGAKCAHSYIKQVLKDKRRKLAMLRHQRANGLH